MRVAFVLWDQVTVLDDWLNIPAGGLSGFRSCMANHSGMSTSRLSVVLCPIAFLCGALGGTIAGHIVSKGLGNTEDAEPIAPAVRRCSGPPELYR